MRAWSIALGIFVGSLGLPAGSAAQSPDSAQSPDEIDAQSLSKLPKQTRFVEADYPVEAQAQGIETDVILLLDISAEGMVDAVAIGEPGEPAGMGFEEAAMAAALGFEFEPAEMDGVPIAVQITYRYRFQLTAPAPPEPAQEVPATPDMPPDARGTENAEVNPSAAARAPVVNFSGVLRERGTRLPMAGVLVTVFRDGLTEEDASPIGFEATSDASGAFQFYDLAPGDWKVLVEAPGYYPFRTTEEIGQDEAIDATYYVERGSYNPYDVTVTAPKPRKEVSRTVLSAQEIDKIPGAAGDPLAVVQNFAGVARAPAFSGQIIVRGSAPEDTRVFVDGAEVPIIYHFGGLRSVLPVGILEGIEFYPGNFSPYYGRATGGVIDARIKQLSPKKVGGYADVSLLDTGLYLEVPLGDKGGIAVAARRSYIDAILKAAVPSSAPINLITAPRYYDYQLLANYRPSAAHDLRALVFGSDDRLELLFTNPADLDPNFAGNSLSAATRFYRGLFTYRYVPNAKFENVLRFSHGRDWLNFNAGQASFNVDLASTQLRDTVRHTFSSKVALSYGVDVLLLKSDAQIRLPMPPVEGQPPGALDLNNIISADVEGITYWSPATFVEAELAPFEKLLVLPGVRIDHFQRIGQTVVQPRLTTRWQFAERLTAKAGVGLYAQEPTFDATDDNFGNPDLKAEQALHYSAGVEYKPQPWITVDVTGFYKELSSLVSRTDAVVGEGDDLRPLLYDNDGRGRVYGMELVARHDFTKKFSGWLAYTLSRADRRDSGATVNRLFDYDQTHILTAIASYHLPRNWQIGTRFRLVSGNPRTPITGAVFSASADRYMPVYGGINTDRMAPFHQLDLRIDKKWIYQSWMLNVYLDIQNVYNRANPEGLTYNFDFSQSSPQQGLPMLAILGVRAEF